MILSAMMFALGVFVTGLVSLGFCIALVRRTRRVTERRLMAAVTARRGEFEAERDELRARHAVQMHRLEREVARVLDMATAHRLDADVKDRDLLNIRAELDGKAEEIQELQERLVEQREALQEVERKYAETSAALRASRHALKLESRRRTAMEDPLDQALAVADEKKIELSALQAQVESLQAALAKAQRSSAEAEEVTAGPNVAGQASIIPLPVRARADQEFEPGGGWNAIDAETVGDDGAERDWASPRLVRPTQAWAGAEDAAQDRDGHALPMLASDAIAQSQEAEPGEGDDANAESMFVEALAKIRALKRAAGLQAAE